MRTVKQADAVLSEPRVRAGLLGLKEEGARSLWPTHEGEMGKLYSPIGARSVLTTSI